MPESTPFIVQVQTTAPLQSLLIAVGRALALIVLTTSVFAFLRHAFHFDQSHRMSFALEHRLSV